MRGHNLRGDSRGAKLSGTAGATNATPSLTAADLKGRSTLMAHAIDAAKAVETQSEHAENWRPVGVVARDLLRRAQERRKPQEAAE